MLRLVVVISEQQLKEPMMMKSKLVTLTLMSLLAGCGSPGAATDPLRAEAGESADGVTLTADAVRYRHGDTIQVRLVNNGTGNVGYNLCSAVRERETGSGWEVIEPTRMCTAALYPLPPGDTAGSSEPVDSEWGTGRYRIATTIYVGEADTPRRLSTGTFEIAP